MQKLLLILTILLALILITLVISLPRETNSFSAKLVQQLVSQVIGRQIFLKKLFFDC